MLAALVVSILAAGAAVPGPAAPGTTITPDVSTQVMLAEHVRGERGTWRRYEYSVEAGEWLRVDNRRATAFFGYGGVVPAARRVQSSGATPAGTFGIIATFGREDPGSHYPYRVIRDRCDWWDQRPQSPTYNRWIRHCGPVAGSEQLMDFRADQYRQAVVLDFNYHQRVRRGPGSGAGIFVHVAHQATAGCVGLSSAAEVRRVVQWLDPAQHPRVVVRRSPAS